MLLKGWLHIKTKVCGCMLVPWCSLFVEYTPFDRWLRRLSCVNLGIDGHPIASGGIVEESEPIRVVLGNLACVISFNVINSLEHPVISLVYLGLNFIILKLIGENEQSIISNENLNQLPCCYEQRFKVSPNFNHLSMKVTRRWMKKWNVCICSDDNFIL